MEWPLHIIWHNAIKFYRLRLVKITFQPRPIVNVHTMSFYTGKKKKKKRNQTVPKDEDNDSMETDTQKGHHSNKVPSSEATPETKGIYHPSHIYSFSFY